MAYPSSASGWTNASSALAADGSDASIGTTLDSGSGTPSATLSCSGYGLSAGAGDTVTGITVTVHGAKYSSGNANGGYITVFLMKNGTSVGAGKSAQIGTGAGDVTLGGSTDNWGSGLVGADLPNLGVGVYFTPNNGGVSTAVYTAFVDAVEASVTVTDTTPNAFSFNEQDGVAPGSLCTSNQSQITGISAAATVSISSDSGGQWSVNNSGVWNGGAGSVNNGDFVQVRHTATGTGGGASHTTLTVGGVAATFTTVTQVPDTTPDAFGFGTVNGAQPNTQYQSGSVTPTGFNAAASVSVSSGGWYKNGTYMGTGPGSINPGDFVQVVGTASGAFGGNTTVRLVIGGIEGDYSINTRAADTTPDQFNLGAANNVALSTEAYSAQVTITGIEAPATMTLRGAGTGQYQINGPGDGSGSWFTSDTTVNNGDRVQVRHVSAAANSTSITSTLTVGGVASNFTSTTVGADNTPDPFGFNAKNFLLPGVMVVSNVVTITGINVPTTVSTVYGLAQVSINGGAYSTSGTITNGQTLQVRMLTSSVPGMLVHDIVQVGTVGADYYLQTMFRTQPDF